MSTLVSCKTATETNKQSIRVNTIKDLLRAFGITAIFYPLITIIATNILYKMLLLVIVDFPQALIRHRLYSTPNSFICLCLHIILAEDFSKKTLPFSSRPSRHVYTIRNIANVQLLWEETWPNRRKHFLRNDTMQFTYPISFLTSIQGKCTH